MTEKKSSKSKKAPAAVPETTPVAAKAPPEAVKAPVEAVKAPATAAKPAPAAKAAPAVAAKAPVEAVKPVEAKPAVTAAPAPATTPGVVAVKSATLKSAAARMFTQSIATAKATANTSKSHRVEDSAKVSQKPMGAGGSRAPRRGAAKGR